MENQKTVNPWYKQFWPWFLLSIPVASILLSMMMITFAVTSPDTLVSDDYYKDGLSINQDLSKDLAAKKMRITADLVYLPESNNYQVSLHGMLPDSPYSYLLLNMEHPTLSGQDKVFQLTPSGENLYTFDPGLQLSGKWYLTITPPDQIWRLTSEIAFPVESVTLTPESGKVQHN